MTSLKDIAAELNLSVSVVSRVLNPAPDAHAKVAPRTRARVLEACQRMGYRRNRTAEFVKRRRFPGIGVFIPQTANTLTANLLFGISEEAGRKDFPILIHTGMDEASYREFLQNNLELAAGGIITYSVAQYHQTGLLELLDRYAAEGGKVLILNDRTVDTRTKVCMDEFAGGRAAAQMLLESGCRNFYCFREEDLLYAASVNQMRYEGFCARLREEGAQCRLVPSLAELPSMLKNSRDSGVFTVSDLHALTLMHLAGAEGLRAPEDFKLVGYDDMEWAAAMGLSTIHQPFREEGRCAAAKIIDMLYGKEVPDEILQPTAVHRQTTRCQ